MSLQGKAILYSGLGMLALLGLLAFLGVRAVEESSRRTFQERVLTAQMVARGVDQSLDKARNDLKAFAAINSIDLEDGNPVPEKQALENLSRFSRSFTFLFIIDRNGSVLYSKPERTQFNGVPFFGLKALSGTVAKGTPLLTSTMPPGEGQRPVFVVAEPLFSKDGEPDGAVVGWLGLEDTMGSVIEPLQVGETAFVEVVSQEGLVMATTKDARASVPREETEYAAHFATLIKANEAAQETCYRCHETSGGMARTKDILAFAPLSVAPGGVAIRQSQAEALAPARRMEWEMAGGGAFFLVVGLSVTWLGSRSLVHPVRHLTAASRKIAEGDLETAVATSSRDEIGVLANTFEGMRLRLRQSLKEKEERARESEERAQQLSALNSVAATVSQSLDLEQVLGDSLEKTLHILGLEAGAVFLKDASANMRLELSRGDFPESLKVLARLQQDIGVAGTFTPLYAGADSGGNEPRHFISVPLASKGKLLGSLVLVSPGARLLTRLERELLIAIGHQIGTGIENAQLFEESQHRKSEAEALFHIGLEVSRLLNLDRILDSIVEKACHLLEADAVLLSLQEEVGQAVTVRAVSGPLSTAFKGLQLKPGEGVAGKVVSSSAPVVTEDYLSDTTFVHTQGGDSEVREAGLKAHLGVPLIIGERVLGCLSIASQRKRQFGDHEIALLQQLAQLAALAIENARLYGQVQDIAILQERERLAREMHDGLGQVLGYLQLQARGVEDMVKKGQLPAAEKELQEMRKVVRDAYEDVRQGILALRSRETPEAGLTTMLQDYFDGFRRQSGVELDVEVADERATLFPSRVAVQIVRVIQEALANVRKHSHAKKAKVAFLVQHQEAVITIEDDGVGFDPAKFGGGNHQHFGLQTMKERCESVGAKFGVSSQPFRGTTVTVRLHLTEATDGKFAHTAGG